MKSSVPIELARNHKIRHNPGLLSSNLSHINSSSQFCVKPLKNFAIHPTGTDFESNNVYVLRLLFSVFWTMRLSLLWMTSKSMKFRQKLAAKLVVKFLWSCVIKSSYLYILHG